MATVNTVLGPIPTDELGPTLIHEHLLMAMPGWECDALAVPYSREAIARSCVGALERAKAYGMKTLVDATPIDLGRDVELQKEVSDRSGINIICATGLYMEAMGKPAYLKFRSQVFDTATEIYETFMKEITQGIGDTGVKAGVIKVATGQGEISPYEERVLRAAAWAQKETGVPIITHTEGGTMGPEQAALLISEGATPERIVIGHIGGNANLQYHTSVLEKGVYIAFDRLGIEALQPDTLRKACIIGLVGIGYADRIMLSHDYCGDHSVCWLGRPLELPDFAKGLIAHWHYEHVFKNIIPALKEAGVSDDKIDTMMVQNPRRLFS
ncbi:MAG: phosphotriesterase-related protein [Dehalococcoidia bacterium]|nr:MAG: phosphotriesterase-related protein [Dehalococcoidia bacterium]